MPLHFIPVEWRIDGWLEMPFCCTNDPILWEILLSATKIKSFVKLVQRFIIAYRGSQPIQWNCTYELMLTRVELAHLLIYCGSLFCIGSRGFSCLSSELCLPWSCAIKEKPYKKMKTFLYWLQPLNGPGNLDVKVFLPLYLVAVLDGPLLMWFCLYPSTSHLVIFKQCYCMPGIYSNC